MDEERKNRKPGFATRAIHEGYDASDFLGALVPPVFITSTYAFPTAEEGEAIFRGEKPGYVYGRTRNPTQALFEARLANLEGAEAGLAVASGMAAISATMFSLLESGDCVLFNRTLYGNSFELFARALPRFGIKSVVVDFTNLEQLAEAFALHHPKLVFFETPSNPTLALIDIDAVASTAKRHGALTVVDNTFATPALQQPLALGADLVVHSATKYLGGHGDLIAGAVVGPARLIDTIRRNGLRNLTGASIAPMTAFLLLRGLKTLELRMERHCASACEIARVLEHHPAVSWVSYPGLAASPFYDLAQRQMSAFGGLITCELHGGKPAGMEFMNRLKLAKLAVSLGDAETLVQHPASMTHATYTSEERMKHGISDGLLRFSIGLESPDDICEDIVEALGES
jgi:methionine-gamma-lyase